MPKIKDIPKVDRPREKFLKKGPDALSKSDLLAILIGSGIKGKNVKKLSGQIIRKFGNNFLDLTVDDLLEIHGIGKTKALQIVSAVALVKRCYDEKEPKENLVLSANDAIALTSDLKEKKKEYLICLYLNARNALLKKDTISIGTLDKSLIHPREIFGPAVELRSAGIILVHNHPSGDPSPSKQDIEVFNKIIEAGKIMGVNVIDFIIIGNGKIYSFFKYLQQGKSTDYVSDGIQYSLFDLIEAEKPAYETNVNLDDSLSPNIFTKNKKTKKGLVNIIDKVSRGDCLEVMKNIPDKSIDMILCDLPYGTTRNKWDSIIPLNKLWYQYERIIKNNGVVALTSQGLFTAKLILSNENLFKYKIVWEKSKPTNFLNAKKQPLRKHEDICIFYKKQPVYNPQMTNGEAYNKGIRKNQLTGSYGNFKPVEVKSNGDRYPIDVIYFKTAESEGEVCHPTQKPVELGRYLIRTFTKPGEVVLDNTCGSGSFLVAAILEGRRFIGIEKNEDVHLFKSKKIDYIDVCNRRIEKATKEVEDKFSL